jgi:hypothetical protein
VRIIIHEHTFPLKTTYVSLCYQGLKIVRYVSEKFGVRGVKRLNNS